MRVVHSTGKEGELAPGAIDKLVETFRGRVVRDGDADYEDARHVFNAAIEKRPALIARCAGVDDVRAAVGFAREHELLLAVRAGGHNVGGSGLCHGGLVVDLTRMTSVQVDPGKKTCRVEGGATWKVMDAETQAFGLGVTGGQVSATGVGGLTLGGGIGWLARELGLSCDNLLSADVVTADGRLLTASADENADLFWALRGGGANFGAVTSLGFRLHPVSTLLAGLVIYPYAAARDVLRWYRDHAASAPDRLCMYALLAEVPGPGKVVVVAISYHGDPAEGDQALGKLRSVSTPIADLVKPMPYAAVQQQLDPNYPFGHHHYWKSGYLKGIDDGLIDAMCDIYERRPIPSCHMLIEQLGGAIARVPANATAYPHRDAPFILSFLGHSLDAAGYPKARDWAKSSFEAARPFYRDAVYVNYVAGDEAVERARQAFGQETFQRLAALKRVYDPNNVFRGNVNITPA